MKIQDSSPLLFIRPSLKLMETVTRVHPPREALSGFLWLCSSRESFALISSIRGGIAGWGFTFGTCPFVSSLRRLWPLLLLTVCPAFWFISIVIARRRERSGKAEQQEVIRVTWRHASLTRRSQITFSLLYLAEHPTFFSLQHNFLLEMPL